MHACILKQCEILTYGQNKIGLVYGLWTDPVFFVVVVFLLLTLNFFFSKTTTSMEFEADDIRDTVSSLTLKGRSLTQFLLGNSCVQKW